MEVEKILKKLEKVFTESNGKTEIAKNYVNPTAAALLTFAGYEVTKQDGSPLSISKNDLLEDFNRNNELTSTKAVEVLDLIFDNSGFMDNFTEKYGNELTIPIDVHASLPEQLISTERAGTQTNAASRELKAVIGTELFCRNVELQKDITIKLLRNNLYNPDFVNEIDEDLSTEMYNDFLRLATNGYADSYSSIGDDFYTLAIGHEKELQTANGSWTNSNGSTILVGRFGNKITPARVDTTQVSGIDSATDTPTGSEIIDVLDLLIQNQPDDYKDDPDNVFVMSRTDAEKYADGRIGVSGNNVTQENWRTSGIIPPYKGRRVLVNPYKKSLGASISGSEVKPNIYLGKLSEFYVGAQKRVDVAREYNPRSSSGGAAIEITKHFYIDFKVRNKESIVIAFAGATVDTPVLMDDNSVKNDQLIVDGDNFTEADTFYPYCDQKGVEIYMAQSDANQSTATALLADYATCVAALGTGDDSTALLTPGEGVLLAEIGGAKTYFAVAAFKDGVLTRSSVVEFDLTIA